MLVILTAAEQQSFDSRINSKRKVKQNITSKSCYCNRSGQTTKNTEN